MERAAEALGAWARSEMGLGAGGAPEGAALRRLCSGPCADIWAYVTRHVRHPRNVKKIRGNLTWYQQLEQKQRLRGGGARGGPLRRRAGGLRGGAAAAAGAGGRLRRLRGGLGRSNRRRSRNRSRWGQEGPPPLSLALVAAAGMEPPVLAATRSVCALRAAALQAQLEPRPRTRPRGEAGLKAANERWVRAAQALLSRHPPRRVLEALELLARESGRDLLRPRPQAGVLENQSESSAKATPTVETLIEEHWGAVGGLWSRRPPLGPPRRRLRRLLRELRERLGGGDGARLLVTAAALRGLHAGLAGGVLALAPPPGATAEGPGAAWGRAVTKQRSLLRQQRLLRTLLGEAAARPPRLPPRRQQVTSAAAALAGAPPTLLREGGRLQGLLGALGASGEPQGGNRDPLALPPPLQGVCDALEFPLYKAPAALLPHAAERRLQLRRLRGLQRSRHQERRERPLPLDGHQLASALGGQREAEAAALLPRLRALGGQCRSRLDAWPRLLALVSQWWDPPVQRVLATLPGHTPFSHWLQRWSRAAQGPASS